MSVSIGCACNAENPIDLDELPAVYKAAVLRMLSPELPLEIVVDRIDDEDYWKRRCDLTWDLSKVVNKAVTSAVFWMLNEKKIITYNSISDYIR